MTITEEDRRRIYEEELAREQARRAIRAEVDARRWRNALVVLGVFALVGILVVFSVAYQSCKSSQKAPPQTAVSYEVIREWYLPAGRGQLVLIPSSNRNEQDLRVLGSTLKEGARGYRNALAFVFDDVVAARLYDNPNLDKKQERYLADHQVAWYNKNGSTGFHRMTIRPGGRNSKEIEINYETGKP
jgi:hypothetical protein